MFIPTVLHNNKSEVELIGKFDEMVSICSSPTRLLQDTIVLFICVHQYLSG